MPTPVSTAKQCLNSDASHALNEAVLVARRRGHAQTTSLHAVAAFLSLSSSQLREACIRAGNTALYPGRVQLKALDFCLSVALERLPTSHPRVDEPPVSNSLMAAIKRSQANQRRQPECIISVRNPNHHHQPQEQLGSSSGIKVELQPLIVSILDDPIVSRVFNDAGFRSFDVKLAIFRPFQSFFRYPYRGKGNQGMFMSSIDGGLKPAYRPFQFPFWGLDPGCCDWDEEYRRIGEVLVRKKGRNPLLVGVCANDALRGFVEVLEREKELNILPVKVCGIKVVSIEKDVLKFVTENSSDEAMGLRFKEAGMMVESCLGPGLVVSFGNLRCFLGGENGFGMDVVNSIVRSLSKLLEVHGDRVWLIGFATNDQTYMEFLRRFPLVDKDWDLHLLPITSVKPLIGGDSCFKSSLMGSFVPFGGFFSSPSDLKASISYPYQHVTHRNQFNENFEQETDAFPKRGSSVLVADQHKNALSPWLQIAEARANNASNDLKAKGGKMLLGDSDESFPRKWDSGCQHRQHSQASPESETYRECFELPTAASSYCFQGKAKGVNSEKHSTSLSRNPVLLRSLKDDNFLAKLSESPSGTDHSPPSGSWLCISGGDDGNQTSPSGVSVITELGLELFPSPPKQQKKGNSDSVDESHSAKYSTHSSFNLAGKSDSNNFQTLFEALLARVGRQSAAVRTISQIITESWTASNERLQKSGLRVDTWLNLAGPDLFGKRKVALALAKTLYGSEKNFIHVNFFSKHGLFLEEKVFGHQISDGSDVRFRGKTVVDHIAEELRKTPFGVVCLDNAHFADPVAQQSLSKAIKTGKFSDSHGREVPINNRTFVLTSEEDSPTPSKERKSNFLEERIITAKCWPVQVTVRNTKNIPNQNYLNKKKRVHRESGMSLDLNLPAEINDDYDDDRRSDSWLDELSNESVNTLVKVVFDPFDYDALSAKILKRVHQNLYKTVGFECSLEIEPRVMDQILAAACLSSKGEREVEDWVDRVLGKGFADAQKRYQLSMHSVISVSSCGALYAEEHTIETCLLPSKVVLT